jgi:Spy/CpxP family protein refolding chaperone
MRRGTAIVVIGLVLATVGAAGQQRTAQRPPQKDAPQTDQRGDHPRDPQRGKWWQDEHFKSELRLTPEQSARIEEIFQAWMAKGKNVVSELNRREDELSNLISGSDDVTEAQVLKQADQVEAIRSDLGKSRILMLFRVRRVLSPEQRVRLATIQKEQQERVRAPGRPPERH